MAGAPDSSRSPITVIEESMNRPAAEGANKVARKQGCAQKFAAGERPYSPNKGLRSKTRAAKMWVERAWEA